MDRPRTSSVPREPSSGITFLAGLDRDLRQGLMQEIHALWTHHSTALEGNSLTLGDTRFVLQEGLTVSGKPLRHHQEVIGHAQAIDVLYELVADQRALTSTDLFRLHTAVQGSSQPRDYFLPIGAWKIEPNGTVAVTSSGGSRWHDYAKPDDVPDLMASWIATFPTATDARSALDQYTDLHLGFTAIHPFADGNGRLARLVANIPVITAGEVPILIPSHQRRAYLELMGDWSVSRGAPRPGETLVPREEPWKRLRSFFAEVSEPARQLVAEFRQTQDERRRT
jgi:Fic family protein